MKNKQIIHYVYPRLSSFIKSDVIELSKHYEVIQNKYNWGRKYLVPFFILSQFLYFIFNIKKAKCVIVSFGGYWAWAPSVCGKLFGVPVYIILHGTDCASIPQLNYGSLRKPIQKKIIKWSLTNASRLLPVSKSLVITTNNFNDKLAKKQGYIHHFPNLKTGFEVIPNGFDVNYWSVNRAKESGLFLSVFSESQFYLKGGDLILEIARKLPELRFEIVGCNAPNISIPDNVVFKGSLSPDDLKSCYERAQYYMQLSSYEGFGCSLAEAMLCGCIPIVSNVNILPDIVGSTGYILERKDSQMLRELINEALIDSTERQFLGRDRIIENYPMSNRIEKLREIIDN